MHPDDNIVTSNDRARVFVVGCSRSGTTIVQSMIAREFGLWTLPETGFFNRRLESFYGRASALSGLYYALHNRRRGNRLVDLFAVMGFLVRTLGWVVALGGLSSAAGAARIFATLLDRQASKLGTRGWLEKTPKHFRHLGRIRKLVSQPRFVFVIRNGKDVVASIRDRYNRNPGGFPGEGDVQYGIDLWNESMQSLMLEHDQPDVLVLCYEAWVADPEREYDRLADFFEMKRAPSGTTNEVQITRSHETWKQNTTLDRITSVESKFNALFSDDEGQSIRAQLRADLYERFCNSKKTG